MKKCNITFNIPTVSGYTHRTRFTQLNCKDYVARDCCVNSNSGDTHWPPRLATLRCDPGDHWEGTEPNITQMWRGPVQQHQHQHSQHSNNITPGEGTLGLPIMSVKSSLDSLEYKRQEDDVVVAGGWAGEELTSLPVLLTLSSPSDDLSHVIQQYNNTLTYVSSPPRVLHYTHG